jgi:MFS family permease
MATNPAAASADVSRISNRVLALLALSVFINYIDRSNLSVAAPMLKDELGLSASQLGVLLSAFFWTYAGLQLTSGWLVDHFEVKWVFAFGFLIWSTATAMTGMAHSFTVLLVVRIVLGMGESVAYPSYSKIMANHCGERHRGFANSMIAMGLALGPAFGVLFGGTLIPASDGDRSSSSWRLSAWFGSFPGCYGCRALLRTPLSTEAPRSRKFLGSVRCGALVWHCFAQTITCISWLPGCLTT